MGLFLRGDVLSTQGWKIISLISYLQYIFYNRDPRRVQPVVDQLLHELRHVDFHGESTFDIVKILSFFRSFYEQIDWKFYAWAEDALDIYWPQLNSNHDDVRLAVRGFDTTSLPFV